MVSLREARGTSWRVVSEVDTVASKQCARKPLQALLRNVTLDVEAAALAIPLLQDERRRIVFEVVTANEALEAAKERLDVIDERLEAAWAMLRMQETLYHQVRKASEAN